MNFGGIAVKFNKIYMSLHSDSWNMFIRFFCLGIIGTVFKLSCFVFDVICCVVYSVTLSELKLKGPHSPYKHSMPWNNFHHENPAKAEIHPFRSLQ